MPSKGDNERLVDELRELVDRVDPVPADVTAYAERALAFRRTPDTRLAKEKRVSPDPVAVTRSDEAAERHFFELGTLTIDVDVEATGSGFVLRGKLEPASRASIEVQRDDGTLLPAVAANDRGQFRLELSDGGRVRLAVGRESQPAVETSWFTV